MSFLIRRALRFVAQKVAADPRAREKAGTYARLISDEVKTISRDEDRARAAGRSVRRLVKSWQGDSRDSRASRADRNRDDDTNA